MADIEKLSGEEFVSRYGTAPLAADKKPTVKVQGCAACCGLHRGVTEELECLRAAVRAYKNK